MRARDEKVEEELIAVMQEEEEEEEEEDAEIVRLGRTSTVPRKSTVTVSPPNEFDPGVGGTGGGGGGGGGDIPRPHVRDSADNPT